MDVNDVLLVNDAVKSANTNPLGMEILVDDVVKGVRFGQISEGAQQIVKVDGDGNMEAFARVMGSNYRPMRVKEFIQHVNDFRGVGNFGEPKYHADKNGRRVFAFLPNEGGDWVLNGSKMSQSMIIATSFDGTMPLTIGGKTFFHRCANMFSDIYNAAKIRNSKFKMENHLLNYKAEIGGFKSNIERFHENAEKLMEVELDRELKDAVTKKILNIPKVVDLSWGDEKLSREGGVKGRKLTTLNELTKSVNQEMNALGDNAWGYLNGITHFTTHTKNNGEGYGVDSISMKYNKSAYAELMTLT